MEAFTIALVFLLRSPKIYPSKFPLIALVRLSFLLLICLRLLLIVFVDKLIWVLNYIQVIYFFRAHFEYRSRLVQ